MTWNEACERAGGILDENDDEFAKRVAKASQRLYNGKFVSQMNVARKSIWESGFKAGKAVAQIAYRCNVCNEPIIIEQNGKAHEAVVRLMHRDGWGHAACHETGG